MKRNSAIQSFRDVTKPDDLVDYKDEMSKEVYKRCLYVVEEIERTQKAAKLLKENDVIGFGKLMFQTHDGLRYQYHVSSKELDFLVDAAKENEDVVGSRLMGGGFGGCTINLIKKEGVKSFLSKILPAYKKQFDIDAEVYDVKVVGGTHEIEEK